MNFDGLWGMSPAVAPKVEEASTKVEPVDWLSAFSGGGKSEPEGSKKNAEVDWLASFTGGLAKVTEDTTKEAELDISKPITENNDWFGNITGTIGFGVPKTVTEQEVKPKEEDWFASIAGGLGFQIQTVENEKEIPKAENTRLDLKCANQDPDESPSLDIAKDKIAPGREQPGTANEENKVFRSKPSTSPLEARAHSLKQTVGDTDPVSRCDVGTKDIPQKHVAMKQNLTDQDAHDHKKNTNTNTPSATSNAQDLEAHGTSESKQKVAYSDKFQNESSHSTEEKTMQSGTNTLSSSFRDLLEIDDAKEDKSSGGEDGSMANSMSYSPSVAQSVTRPHLSRKTMENSFLTNSIRSLIGLADDEGSTRGSRDGAVKENAGVAENTCGVVTVEKQIARDATGVDGIMSFFGSLLGQHSTTGTEASRSRDETLPGELNESHNSDESSESAEDRSVSNDADNDDQSKALPHVGNNQHETTTSPPGQANDFQAQIDGATETLSHWVSGVQAFVSHHVAEITDKVLVIPRHPKAHKGRAQSKKWWSFQSLSSYAKFS
jgi:hypothetical protein